VEEEEALVACWLGRQGRSISLPRRGLLT